jgi:hypothetical protein
MIWSRRDKLRLARDAVLLTIGLGLILVDALRGEI